MEERQERTTRQALSLAALVFLGLLLSGCAAEAGSGAAADSEVVVYAAASLTEPFRELGQLFAAQHGATTTFNFGGSNQLRAQLEQGARADVFASANEKEMALLAEAGLVDGQAQVFAINKLVVVVPRSNPAEIRQLRDLARPGLKIVLAGPNVPVGGYARQALERLSQDPAFDADYADRVRQNVVSHETDVKQVLAKVQLGEADAGIVYASDVTEPLRQEVQTLPIPEQHNVVARYPIAVVRAAPAAELAHAFVELALSAEGQAILQRHGLEPAR